MTLRSAISSGESSHDPPSRGSSTVCDAGDDTYSGRDVAVSDYGDFCREQRQSKRMARLSWHECPSPGCQFGGNPVKVPPGGKCLHCGWQAPGKEGDNPGGAHRHTSIAQPKRDTCKTCGKKFKTEQGRAMHEREVHGAKVQAQE